MVVEYETKTGRVNKGVATNWLRNKLISDNGHKSTVPMFIRKSQFRLPFKATNPVIMVGPGTGIAPFMGFIQERGWLKQQGLSICLVVLDAVKVLEIFDVYVRIKYLIIEEDVKIIVDVDTSMMTQNKDLFNLCPIISIHNEERTACFQE